MECGACTGIPSARAMTCVESRVVVLVLGAFFLNSGPFLVLGLPCERRVAGPPSSPSPPLPALYMLSWAAAHHCSVLPRRPVPAAPSSCYGLRSCAGCAVPVSALRHRLRPRRIAVTARRHLPHRVLDVALCSTQRCKRKDRCGCRACVCL